MKIVIIGTGLIGCERIKAVQHISQITNEQIALAAVYDNNNELLLSVKEKYKVNTVFNIHQAMQLKPDWVFICTSNDSVYEIAKISFEAGANVLLEKPFGRTLEECDKIISLKPKHLKLNVGFNYRFFDGIEAAIRDTKEGKFGKLISVNLTLAHGNSPGMEKSWKLDPIKCGSVVTDLGVHLFDIILQLSSHIPCIKYAQNWSGFWNTGIDEEAHCILLDNLGTIFNAQVSLNRWRSSFELKINGTEGYGIIKGRGRSYGPQSYKTGKRWGWSTEKTQADSEITVINNNDCTNSFLKETISILGLSEQMDQKNGPMACSFNEAKNIMLLLNQYNNIIKYG